LSDERTARISLAGDLDIYRRDEIVAMFPFAESIDRVIIDLREATSLDSTILSAFMRYRRTFVDAGKDPHEIVIVVNPQLRRVFEITGLLNSLTVVSAAGEVGTAETAAPEPLGEV
jgi:anti-anti-sigma factor